MLKSQLPDWRQNIAYKVIVTENAAQQVENILDYIIYRLHNEKAAIEILNEIEATYKSLEYLADSMAFCYDSYLRYIMGIVVLLDILLGYVAVR